MNPVCRGSVCSRSPSVSDVAARAGAEAAVPNLRVAPHDNSNFAPESWAQATTGSSFASKESPRLCDQLIRGAKASGTEMGAEISRH